MSRVLVAGVPRSGTTWVGDVLGRSPGVRLISEPDNLHVDPLAGAATRPFGRFPVLRPGEPGGLYATLWTLAFRGGWPWAGTVALSRRVASRFSPRACYRLLGPAARACALRPPYPGDVVVKTVYGVLSLEWIAEHTGARILVVRRNLLDTVASWLALHAPGYPLAAETPRAGNVTGNEPMAARVCPELGTRMPDPDEPHVRRVAWTVAVLDAALAAAVQRNPGWHVVEHEALCSAPSPGFREVFQALGLAWSDAVDAYIEERDVPGTGYLTKRVARDVPGRWRERLGAEQREEIAEGFRRVRSAATAAALDALSG
jgi:hypothetical protein